MDTNSTPRTILWIADHFNIIMWPTIVGLAWKASSWVTGLHAQATKTVEQINALAENHFPHIQESLNTQDGLLKSMDNSLKIMVTRMPEQAKAASMPARRMKR